MIITKLQQFIIFNCDQPQITIPSSLSTKISKITKINPPTGSSLVTWSDGAPVQQLNLLDPNTIYLITSKEGQLGYELIGATDPLGYCSNKITPNYTLNVDNYHIILDKFFDKNYDIYYFDSNYVTIPDNCDYAIRFDSSNKVNRNFSIFSNEDDYPNLFFQYTVDNLNPQINDKVTFSIRVINPSSSDLSNILLNFKQNFDLNFQGILEYLSLQDDSFDLIKCGGGSDIRFYPNQWNCCTDNSARQLSSQCESPTSINLNLLSYGYQDIDIIFKVTNPPNTPIILGEPNFEAMNVAPGQVISSRNILGFSIKNLANLNSGVVIGKKGDEGKTIVNFDKIIEAIDAWKAAEASCKADGGDPKITIGVSTDSGYRSPSETSIGNFILLATLGKNQLEKRKLVEEKIQYWLKNWGNKDSQMFIKVECVKNGSSTTIYPPTIPPNNPSSGSGETIGSNDCDNTEFTPREPKPGCKCNCGLLGNDQNSTNPNGTGLGPECRRECCCGDSNFKNLPYCTGPNNDLEEFCNNPPPTFSCDLLGTPETGAPWPEGTCKEKYKVDQDAKMHLPKEPCPIVCINPPDCDCENSTTTTTTTTTPIPTSTPTTPPPFEPTPPPKTPTPTPQPTPTPTPIKEGCKKDSDCIYEGQSNGYIGPNSCVACLDGECISQLLPGETCCDSKRCTGECCTGCMDGFGPTYQHCCTTDINGWPAHCVDTSNGVTSGTCCEGCPSDPSDPSKPLPGCGSSSGEPVGNI